MFPKAEAHIIFNPAALDEPSVRVACERDLGYIPGLTGPICQITMIIENGKFSSLERALEEGGFPFDSWNHSSRDLDPERRYFRPGEGIDVYDIYLDSAANFLAPVDLLAAAAGNHVEMRETLDQYRFTGAPIEECV